MSTGTQDSKNRRTRVCEVLDGDTPQCPRSESADPTPYYQSLELAISRIKDGHNLVRIRSSAAKRVIRPEAKDLLGSSRRSRREDNGTRIDIE